MGKGLGPLFLGILFSLLTLSTISMALRFYCRASIVKMVRSDDWIMLVAFVNAWGLGITNTLHVKYGIGARAKPVQDYNTAIVPVLKLWYVYQLQYLITLFLIKASILSFYRRISPERSYQLAIAIVSGIVVVFTAAMLFVNIFECPKDPSKAWSPGFPNGCSDLAVVYYIMASFNIISDIVILILPMPSLWRLQTNRRKRVALVLIFSCGFIAVLGSVVRITALYKGQQILAANGDKAYVAIYVLLWSQVEVNFGIITASAPALKPLVHSILQSTSHSKPSYAQNVIGYAGTGQRSGRGVPLRSLGCREANRLHGNTTVIDGGPSESQEDIVIKGDGIVRTVEVKVDMEADGRSEDSIRRLEFER